MNAGYINGQTMSTLTVLDLLILYRGHDLTFFIEFFFKLPQMIEKIERNNFLCNLDIRVRKYPGKMARQNFGRFVKTIKTLRFNKNIHQKNSIDNFFKCFRYTFQIIWI